MARNNFLYKTHCELVIKSNVTSPDIITGELAILPERMFKKGEQFISRNSGSIIIKPHNLWAIKSKTSELEEETISHHIDYFKSILQSKMEILEQYKKDTRLDLTFWIWIETDNAGIGFELDQSETTFINQFSNRIQFSLIAKSNPQDTKTKI